MSVVQAFRSVARLLGGNSRLVVAGVVTAVIQAALLLPIVLIVREIFD